MLVHRSLQVVLVVVRAILCVEFAMLFFLIVVLLKSFECVVLVIHLLQLVD